MADVPYKPEGYHTATTYLIVNDGMAALEFYKKAFNATELMSMPMPDGKLGHAEIKIGDSPVMLADECPEMGAISPATLNGTSFSMLLYVEDVDSFFQQAIDAGAKEVRPIQDQFYGDRSGILEDPFGHKWSIATHIEDVSPEEMEKRMAAMGEASA